MCAKSKGRCNVAVAASGTATLSAWTLAWSRWGRGGHGLDSPSSPRLADSRTRGPTATHNHAQNRRPSCDVCASPRSASPSQPATSPQPAHSIAERRPRRPAAHPRTRGCPRTASRAAEAARARPRVWWWGRGQAGRGGAGSCLDRDQVTAPVVRYAPHTLPRGVAVEGGLAKYCTAGRQHCIVAKLISRQEVPAALGVSRAKTLLMHGNKQPAK